MMQLLSNNPERGTLGRRIASRKEKFSLKRVMSILLHRVVLVTGTLLLQVALIVFVLIGFNGFFPFLYLIGVLVSLAVVAYIICNRSAAAYKISWIVPILLFPLFGGVLFLLLGGYRQGRKDDPKLHGGDLRGREELKKTPGDREQLLRENHCALRPSDFIRSSGSFPVYRGEAVYYAMGDDVFPAVLDALRRAERFIFLEYFIIQPGVMWDSILTVLKEKAEAGVDVRVIYDDVGSMFTMPPHYGRKLQAMGIRCAVFNPYIPILSTRLNNRDHRKLMVIDGVCGFMGGYNLADEYINRLERFGVWKDSGVRLEGESVWTLTVMFLAMWDATTGSKSCFEDYRGKSEPEETGDSAGFLQPYFAYPADNDSLAENVILDIVARAEHYVYLSTPYLVIDESMTNALCQSAKSGVDVRIVTPRIPDKKMVFEITQSHYLPLLEAGVRIYEYTPGFMHAKNVVSDDTFATVGSVNLDYRSLFLHYECGVWMCGGSCVTDVKRDFDETLAQCQEVTTETFRPGPIQRLLRAILRFFAPML